MATINTCFWRKCQTHISARTLATLHEVYVSYPQYIHISHRILSQVDIDHCFPKHLHPHHTKMNSPSLLPPCPTSLFCYILTIINMLNARVDLTACHTVHSMYKISVNTRHNFLLMCPQLSLDTSPGNHINDF